MPAIAPLDVARDQLKPARHEPLRHLGQDTAVLIPVSETRGGTITARRRLGAGYARLRR